MRTRRVLSLRARAPDVAVTGSPVPFSSSLVSPGGHNSGQGEVDLIAVGASVELGTVEDRSGFRVHEHPRATFFDDLITRSGLGDELDGELGLAGGADPQPGFVGNV